MNLNVELRQLVGTISSAIGPIESKEDVDAIMVNGVLAGYIERREGAKIFGVRPVIPESVWPQMAEEVKRQRPDADISFISGVSMEAIDAANQEDDDDEGSDVE